MQINLLGKSKTPVEVKESYGGFKVCYPNHIDYVDITPRMINYGSEMVKKHDSYQEAKDYFEKEIRRTYKADVKWNKSKFQDSKGVFWLDGVKINWELETAHIGMYHFEFNSDKIPNLITSTGYLSHFSDNLDAYNSIKEHIIDCVEFKINHDETGTRKNKLISYRLDFEDKGYSPSKQFTLIELQGGEKNG